VSTYQLANLLAALGGGRNPQWSKQADSSGSYDGAPTLVSSGTSLVAGEAGGVLVCNARVALRRAAHRREAWVTVTTFDAGATWTTTLNGTAISKGASATADIALIGLRDAILADATVGGAAGANQVVTALCLDSDGDETTGTVAGGNAAVTLVVRGTVEDDFTIVKSATGTGVLDCVAEASIATVRIWLLADSDEVAAGQSAPTSWDLADDGEFEIDRRGWTERLAVGGYSQIWIEVCDLSGPETTGCTYSAAGGTDYPGGGVFVGPCISES
jgi:hypothetical protein